jgi:cytochrome P450
MMAATETTASLISNIIRILATNPPVFAKLRAEVLAVGDEPLEFDRLGRIRYLQNVISESTFTSFLCKP